MTAIMDASALETFRECPEVFRLKYRKHLQPAGWDEAMDSGSAFHAALKVWFDDGGLEAAQQALEAAWGDDDEVLEMFGVVPAQQRKRPLSLFRRLLEGYAQRWPRETEAFEVVRNEAYVEGHIGPKNAPPADWCHKAFADVQPFRWCGIIDRKIRLSDGSEYVMDTKTTSAYLGKDYFEAFRFGTQLPGYVGLELVNGRRCDGYYIDAVHVDTRSQSVKPDHFVRWGPVKLLGWELTRWARDVEHTLQEIARLDNERGADVPWPIYNNFKFGRVLNHAYYEFFNLAPELHPDVEKMFEVREWQPATVRQG